MLSARHPRQNSAAVRSVKNKGKDGFRSKNAKTLLETTRFGKLRSQDCFSSLEKKQGATSMNDREQMSRENNNAQRFEMASHRHRNCVRLNSGSSIEHEAAKSLVCYHLLKKGHTFLTEAIVNGSRKRCDIVDLTESTCIEIVYSEEAESIKQKRTEYPFFIMVVEVGKPLPKFVVE